MIIYLRIFSFKKVIWSTVISVTKNIHENRYEFITIRIKLYDVCQLNEFRDRWGHGKIT